MVVVRWSFLVVLALVATFAGARVDFSTDITHFMPDSGRAGLAAVSRALATSELSRTMTITLGTTVPIPMATTVPIPLGTPVPIPLGTPVPIPLGTPVPTPIAAPAPLHTAGAIADAADKLATALAEHPEVAWVRDGGDERFVEDVWDLYFPRRFYFASASPERDIAVALSDDALAVRAERAKADLAGPTALLAKRTMTRDPLGLFDTVVRRMRAAVSAAPTDSGEGVVHRDGHLWSSDGHALLFVGTKSSAFASRPQAALLDDLDRMFADIAAAGPVPLVMDRGGANRFAVDAERRIRRDVYRIAALSVVGVAVIFATFFPSAWQLLLVLLPAVSGIVFATATCILWFGRIDGLTLAFGSSLIGVAIDYPIHLLNHQGLVTADARASAKRLAPTLALGAATTMAGFSGLALTAFPGFREIGVFAITGIAAALLVTLFIVPLFAPRAVSSPPRALRVTRLLERLIEGARRQRRLLVGVPLLVIAIAVGTLPSIVWEDDLAKLNQIDPDLQAEEDRVRARASALDGGRFVVAVGETDEEALQASERASVVLDRLIDEGVLGARRSPSDFLPSVDLQQRNARVFAASSGLEQRVADAFSSAGFRADATAGFAKDLASLRGGDIAAPLIRRDLVGSALDRVVSALIVDVDTEFANVAAVTQLSRIEDEVALRSALAAIDGAYFLDQRSLANELYAGFRATTLRQIAVGCALVFVVLLARYRGWRPALAAFAPSALVALLVASMAAASGTPLNLLHAVSLTMVMGMGVDYGIFLVDGVRAGETAGAVTLSLLLSCMTTVMVFGVLALSSNPALIAIGSTTGAGVLLSFLFAPISLVLLGENT